MYGKLCRRAIFPIMPPAPGDQIKPRSCCAARAASGATLRASRFRAAIRCPASPIKFVNPFVDRLFPASDYPMVPIDSGALLVDSSVLISADYSRGIHATEGIRQKAEF